MNIKNNLIYIAGVAIILVALYLLLSSQNIDSNYPPPPADYAIPKTAIHWHPWLKIIIEGKEQDIPDNVGVTIGKKLDSELGSDMGSAPIHTHDEAGDRNSEFGRKLHVESLRPYAKPSTLTLGYFFEVWERSFNSTCILDRCNSGNESVKMFVNDKPNFDFQNYYMRDGDRILITYG